MKIEIKFKDQTYYRDCNDAFYFDGTIQSLPEYIINILSTKQDCLSGLEYGEVSFNPDSLSKKLVYRASNGFVIVNPHSIVYRIPSRKGALAKWEIFAVKVDGPD